MFCPYCNSSGTKVTNKRDSNEVTRRRRECLKCKKRFTTYERVELELSVLKKDGKRQQFNRSKIQEGISRSMEKRPFSGLQIEEIVNDIEARVHRFAKDKDIKSSKIGEIVMNKLKRIDKVAYIRFASVYRDFADLEDFKKELKEFK
jgi:transcriptional repressor NrdR